MRFLMLACCVLIWVTFAAASERDEQAARAALALSGKTTVDNVHAALMGCGICRTDTQTCWKVAGETGKLLVLYVGGCDGKAKDCDIPGAIHVRTTHYEYDQCPTVTKLDMERASVPRVLIFKRFSSTDKRLRLVASLSAKCTAEDVKAKCDECCQCADCHCADDVKAVQSMSQPFFLPNFRGATTCGPNGCGR